MRFILSDEKLELALEGKEKVWSFKQKISVPVEKITNVEWVSGKVNRWRLSGFRAPGTGVPGVFYAGSFYRRAGWEFWYIKAKTPGYLVVTTTIKRYRVLRVTADQKQGEEVVNWFNKYRQSGKVA